MKQYKLIDVHRVKANPGLVINLDLVELDIDIILKYLEGNYKLVRLIVSPVEFEPFDDKTDIPKLQVIKDKLNKILPKYYKKIEIIGLPICFTYPYHNDLFISPTKPSVKFSGAWYSQYSKCKRCSFKDYCIGVPECYKVYWEKGISPIRDDYNEIKDEWR